MTRIRPRRTLGAGLAVTALLATTVACAPGEEGGSGTETQSEDVTTDISEVGDVTLTVWDQEVRGGQAEQIAALNEAFMEEYPNITIEPRPRSFDDLQRTLRNWRITGDDAPDVVQANNGRSDMGAFVETGCCSRSTGTRRPTAGPSASRSRCASLASYSDDGATFGEGSLYGLPQVGEIVGVFYNKAKLDELGLEVPETTAEFEAALAAAKRRRRAAASSSATSTGGRASTTSASCTNQFVPRDDIRNLGFGREGASLDLGGERAGRARPHELGRRGLLHRRLQRRRLRPGVAGLRARATGVFLVAGTWLQADLDAAHGRRRRLHPARRSASRRARRDRRHRAARSRSPRPPTSADAAAAYIDFITSDEAMKMIQEAGNLPVVGGSAERRRGRWRPRCSTPGRRPARTTRSCPTSTTPRRTSTTSITAQVQELGAGSVVRRTSSSAPSRTSTPPSSRAVTPPRDPTAVTPRRPHRAASAFPGGPPAGRSVRGAVRSARRVAPGGAAAGRLRLRRPGAAWSSACSCWRPWRTPCSSRSSSGTVSGSARGSGLDNYVAVFTDPELRGAVRPRPGAGRLLQPCCRCSWGSLLAALMTRSRVRGPGFFRTVIFLPQVVALIVVAVAWRQIYAPTVRSTTLLRLVGLDAPRPGLARRRRLGAGRDRPRRHLGRHRAVHGPVPRRAGQGRPRALRGGPPRRRRLLVRVLRRQPAGRARRARGGADADRGGGAADLRPRLRDDAPAARATRPAVPSYEVYDRAIQEGDVGTGITVALVLTVVILVATWLVNRIAGDGEPT